MAIKASASVTVADVSDGIDGTGIRSTVVEYQAGASGTTAPTGTWKTTVDSTSASNPYLWTRVTYTYTDNSTKVIYSVGSTPEGIEVGGRNLLLNSSFTKNADKWYIDTAGAYREYTTKDGKKCHHLHVNSLKNTQVCRQNILDKLEPNTTYTMSGWVFTENIVKGTTNYFLAYYIDGYYNNNGTSTWFGLVNTSIPVNNGKWQYLTTTFTTDTTKLKSATAVNAYIFSRDFTGDLYFYDIKLEKGNKATDWTPAPEDVDASINEAAKTATNFMELTSNGLVVGDKTASTLGRNILIGNSVIQFRNGTGTILAEYGDSTIYLGKNSKQSKIDLCNGMAEMYNEDSGSSYNRLRINAGHSIKLNAPNAIYMDSYYNNGSGTIGETYIHMESYPIWDGGTIGGTIDLFASKNDHYNSMLSLHSQMANFEVNSADGTSAFLGLTNQGNNATLSASSEILLTAPTITLSGTTTMNNGLRIENCGLELYYSTPFIDFHWNNSSADYTGRIIADAADTLSIVSSKLSLTGNLYFNNSCGFSMRDNAGNSHHIMELNGDNLLCLGYWTSMNNVGSTCIFGRDVNIIVGNADHTWMRPYIRKGDSIALQVDTAGYVTGSGRSLLFMVPLGRQIIGNPTVTASSGNGFIVRQNNKYCYGSSSTAWVYPSSYTVSKYGDGNVGVVINASMPNELNVTNNSPIGIRWNGTITFS